MSNYLAPGVFVEEVSFRSRSIEGVSTSVAAIVGPARFGPLQGRPEVVTSFADFQRIYGDIQDLKLHGNPTLNHTTIAAKAFFDNGGKQLYVSRVGNFPDPDNSFGTASDTDNHVIFRSRFPGTMGNFTLELDWRDSENLLQMQPVSSPTVDEILFLEATGVTNAVKSGDSPDDGVFPLTISALVRRISATTFAVHQNLGQITDTSEDPVEPASFETNGDGEGLLAAAGLTRDNTTSLRFTRVSIRQPASGNLSGGAFGSLSFSAPTDLSGFFDGDHWGDRTTLLGTINAEGTEFQINSDLNEDVDSNIDLPLAALAASPDTVSAVMVQRTFDISVRNGGPDGTVIHTYSDISTAHDADNSLDRRLPQEPDSRNDQLTSPVACEFADNIAEGEVLAALYSLFDEGAMNPEGLSVEGPRYLIQLENGSDGESPQALHYGGATDEVNGSTGFAALEDIEDISIVMAPAAAADPNQHQAVVTEMQKHCRRMRYRMGIVDSQDAMALSEVRGFRSNFNDSRLALYYPWITIADPRGVHTTINVPPAGFIAGIYAHTDVQRGVHKTPANTPVLGALRFAQEINQFQQELLNPSGINCLRSFPGRGHQVWGGRTLSDDPEWKYVNVRRYFLYLERSIQKSTQWAVFEPNGERLWENVRNTVDAFLFNEWRNGRLLGSEKTAWFVRCDRSTMTQNDLDNGRLICEVGVAALKPAEFVVFRIGQKTADS
ncbi:phage tail sheath family protein [Marinobacter orientalis]|uniref:Phage tail protein n=1 Tax=Marinobacter orientalis TaxID=1928859 RepID=A0A7Y0RF00_9GAMM|nr:phage tail sheath subtilisin-like domain-containing protein [Marinobacter orientalis]NMT64998.1 phage tail protein [Marinobacter orientalis]TGX48111.1 phage tail protein [Marinobacter orientalis]